jgi:hypothetical protein
MARKKFNPSQHEYRVRAYLHTITHRFIGQPNNGNTWLWPDVFYWGQDPEGNFYIPDLVAFYFNPTFAYPYEKRWGLERQLGKCIPPRWDCYWFFDQGYIFGERKDIGEESIVPVWMQNMNQHAAHKYDEDLARLSSTNGHKEIEHGDDLLLVSYDEFDSGEILP